jgi:hypothetical protein
VAFGIVAHHDTKWKSLLFGAFTFDRLDVFAVVLNVRGTGGRLGRQSNLYNIEKRRIGLRNLDELDGTFFFFHFTEHGISSALTFAPP